MGLTLRTTYEVFDFDDSTLLFVPTYDRPVTYVVRREKRVQTEESGDFSSSKVESRGTSPGDTRRRGRGRRVRSRGRAGCW